MKSTFVSDSARGICASVLLLIGIPTASAQVENQSPLQITSTRQRHQDFLGWGSSLSPWAADTSLYYEERWRNAFRDLRLNILRVDMRKEVLIAEDGNFSTPVPISQSIEENILRMDFNEPGVQLFGDIAHWLVSSSEEGFNPLIVGAVWSPPHWMKGPTGFEQNWLGVTEAFRTPWLSGNHLDFQDAYTGSSVGGRLRTEDANILADYGRYIAAWVVGFEREYGVPFHAISIQNESTFENPFDSMTLSVAADGEADYGQYALALASVRMAWQQYGITTRIKGPHVAQIGPTPENSWSLNQQMQYLEGVRTYDNGLLLNFLDYYNSNYYMPADERGAMATAGYYFGSAAVDAGWADWTFAPGVIDDGKPIWISEFSGEQAYWGGKADAPADGALGIAVRIINSLVFANASAILYWQLSDGQENETEDTLLGFNNLDNPNASAKYAVFKHFSRFVPPGSVRIEAVFDNGSATLYGNSQYDVLHGLSVVGFYHESSGQLTYVLLNMTETERRVNISPPGIVEQSRYETHTSTSATRFERSEAVPVGNEGITTAVPPFGLVTISVAL